MNDPRLQELKAAAYDLIARIQGYEKQLNEINSEILRVAKELETPIKANDPVIEESVTNQEAG